MQFLKSGWQASTSWHRNITDIKGFNTFQRIYLVVIMLTTIMAFIYTGDYSPAGIASMLTGLALAFYLILLASGRITNFFWGLLTTGMWFIISVHNHLIGDMINQAFFFVMQFVGMYAWQKQLVKQANQTMIESKKLSRPKIGFSIVGAGLLYFVVLAFAKGGHGNQYYLDSAQLPLGVLAQILATYGYFSSWIVWLAVDAVGLLLWWNQIQDGGMAAIGMFILMIVKTINAFYGMYLWAKNPQH
ncbi:MAG: nicotinamide riboside transporter PnuC [Lactobacillaceae bacterium]|jgi:nicotinamide mononucleotide transporter|nr:nicotinamide riboside transporter PnuC [Lactobacillaceae bacterium]